MIADHETALIGPITDRIIDADRLVRDEHGEGFPNFAIYRLILCGDRLYMPQVREWWVGFCIGWSEQEMSRYPGDDLIVMAAWDSLQRTVSPNQPVLNDVYAASELQMSVEAYACVRKLFERILSNIVRVYWWRMVWAHEKVCHRESQLKRNELKGLQVR